MIEKVSAVLVKKHSLTVITIVFIISFILLSSLVYRYTNDYALKEAGQHIEDILIENRAKFAYIEEMQKPIIYDLQKKNILSQDFFAPEILSFTFINRNIHGYLVREHKKAGRKPYYYKLASLNPRNPINKADKTERALINRFNRGEITSFVDIVERDGEQYLYKALPSTKTRESCMRCHGKPEDAPEDIIKKYGDEKGFFEKVGRISAMISLMAPLDSLMLEAKKYFYILNFLIASVMLFIYSIIFFFVKQQRKFTIRISETLIERNQVLQKLDDELSEAADYVRSALPQHIQEGTVRTDWRFIPSASLGGDSFGYHWLDEYNFAVYLLDVSGHGVGASLLSISVLNVLRFQSLPDVDFHQPDQVLGALNESFPSEKHNDMFFTIWYGVYNHLSRVLQFSTGGHPPALLFQDDFSLGKSVIELQTKNMAIGTLPDITFKKDACKISGSARLLVFSDGVFDIERPDGTFWTFKGFADFIAQRPTEEQSDMDRLLQHVRKMRPLDTLDDDFSILEVFFR